MVSKYLTLQRTDERQYASTAVSAVYRSEACLGRGDVVARSWPAGNHLIDAGYFRSAFGTFERLVALTTNFRRSKSCALWSIHPQPSRRQPDRYAWISA